MLTIIDSTCVFLCQDGGGQLVQQAGSVGGSAGVCGSFQRAWSSLWSDCGLDRGSFLPSAATHQYHQVHHPLLLQEGGDVALKQTNIVTQFHFVFPPKPSCFVPHLTLSFPDHALLQLSTSTQDVSLHLLRLLFPRGSPVRLGPGYNCLDLQPG